MENDTYVEPSFTKEIAKAFAISAASMAGAFAGLLGIGLLVGKFGKKIETQTTEEK